MNSTALRLLDGVVGIAALGCIGYAVLTNENAKPVNEEPAEIPLGVEEIQNGMKGVQDIICQFFFETTGCDYHEDNWGYEKGTGGGRTRVWETGNQDIPWNDADFWKNERMLEKAGVNYSGISGSKIPAAGISISYFRLLQGTKAATAFKLDPNAPFFATGVSLVIHPKNPHIPTIHMNIRLD
jgi:coproporphyrinogen III oxidase